MKKYRVFYSVVTHFEATVEVESLPSDEELEATWESGKLDGVIRDASDFEVSEVKELP